MARWLRHVVLVLFGLAVGGGIGLLVGWVLWPTEFTDATPLILQDSYRQDYILMVATAYGQDGELATAVTRLDALGSTGPEQLFAFTLDAILAGRDATETRQLARLADALGFASPAMQPYLPEPEP